LELTGRDPSHGVIVSFIDAQGQVSDVTRRVTFEVDLSPDGSVVACGAANGEVRIFKMENGQRIAQIKSEQGPVFAIAFSSDGARIATGGYDGRIRLYNAANGEAIQGFASVPVP
jgi:WD40 repeat protein